MGELDVSRGGQQGNNQEGAGKQAGASCQHEGDAKNREKLRRVSQSRGHTGKDEGGKGSETGGGECVEGGGRRTAERSAATTGHLNADGRRAASKHKERG